LLLLQGCSIHQFNQIASSENTATKAPYKTQLANINIAINSKSWADAQSKLSNAIFDYPNKKSLLTLRKTLTNKQTEDLRRLETREAISKGYWIKSQTALVQHEKSASSFKWINSFRLFNLNNQRQNLQAQLMKLAYKAIASNDLGGAKDCIKLLKSLDSDFDSNEKYAILQSSLNEVNQEKSSRKNKRLIANLEDALSSKKYVNAAKIVRNLSKPIDKKDRSIVNKAKLIFELEANLLAKKGDDIYRKGDISNAIVQWKKAKKLYPSNPSFNKKITRAIKVKNKMTHLKRAK
jgi:hypothetical protein